MATPLNLHKPAKSVLKCPVLSVAGHRCPPYATPLESPRVTQSHPESPCTERDTNSALSFPTFYPRGQRGPKNSQNHDFSRIARNAVQVVGMQACYPPARWLMSQPHMHLRPSQLTKRSALPNTPPHPVRGTDVPHRAPELRARTADATNMS